MKLITVVRSSNSRRQAAVETTGDKSPASASGGNLFEADDVAALGAACDHAWGLIVVENLLDLGATLASDRIERIRCQ